MRSRRPSPEHQETVSRRLALLSEQLAHTRDEARDVVRDVVRDEPRAVGDEWWGDHTRIAPLRRTLQVVPAEPPAAVPWDEEPEEPAPGPPPDGPAPVVVAVPGRHADRRGLAVGLADLLPETLRGRVALAPGPVAVVAVLVALALAFTCWRVVRDDPEPSVPAPVAAPAGDLVPVTGPAPAAGAPASSASPGAGAAGTPSGTVTVDVAGRVRRPGIVVLDAGSRVADALAKAGGARGSVDLSTLNLARVLVDGEQVLVGVEGGPPMGSPAPSAPGAAPSGAAAPAALVDLNLADQATLESLPDIGPVTAAAIVKWRTEHGAFTAVTELLEVPGIGDATLATLTPLVTV